MFLLFKGKKNSFLWSSVVMFMSAKDLNGNKLSMAWFWRGSGN